MRQGKGGASFKKSVGPSLATRSLTFVDARLSGEAPRKVQRALGQAAGKISSETFASSFITPTPSLRNRQASNSSKFCTGKVGLHLGEIAENAARITKYLEDELVLESGLHVAGVDAGSCYEKFGLPSQVAPPLIGLPDSVDPSTLLDSDMTMELAICLATPSDSPNNRGLEEGIRRSLIDLEERSALQQEIEGVMGSLEELELFEPRKEEQRLPSENIAFWRRRLADSGDGDDDAIQWMQWSGAESK